MRGSPEFIKTLNSFSPYLPVPFAAIFAPVKRENRLVALVCLVFSFIYLVEPD